MPETKKVICLTPTQLKEMKYEHIVNIVKDSPVLSIPEDMEKLLYERFGSLYEQLAMSWPMINGEFKLKKSAKNDVLYLRELLEQTRIFEPRRRGPEPKPKYQTKIKEELRDGHLFGLYGLPKEITQETK